MFLSSWTTQTSLLKIRSWCDVSPFFRFNKLSVDVQVDVGNIITCGNDQNHDDK